MEDPKVLERMRADWNERAGEDAYYYVAFGRRDQDDEEFFATAADVVRGLTAELKRLKGREAVQNMGSSCRCISFGSATAASLAHPIRDPNSRAARPPGPR